MSDLSVEELNYWHLKEIPMRRVKYDKDVDTYTQVGHGGFIKVLEDEERPHRNGKYVKTSTIQEVSKEGVIMTLNTIYIPCSKDEGDKT